MIREFCIPIVEEAGLIDIAKNALETGMSQYERNNVTEIVIITTRPGISTEKLRRLVIAIQRTIWVRLDEIIYRMVKRASNDAPSRGFVNLRAVIDIPDKSESNE